MRLRITVKLLRLTPIIVMLSKIWEVNSIKLENSRMPLKALARLSKLTRKIMNYFSVLDLPSRNLEMLKVQSRTIANLLTLTPTIYFQIFIWVVCSIKVVI